MSVPDKLRNVGQANIRRKGKLTRRCILHALWVRVCLSLCLRRCLASVDAARFLNDNYLTTLPPGVFDGLGAVTML